MNMSQCLNFSNEKDLIIISYQYNKKYKENVANEERRTYDWMRTFNFRKVEISQNYPQQGKDRILKVTVAFNL